DEGAGAAAVPRRLRKKPRPTPAPRRAFQAVCWLSIALLVLLLMSEHLAAVGVLPFSFVTLLDDLGIHPLVAITGLFLVILTVIVSFGEFLIKRGIVNALPDEVEYQHTRTYEFPELDRHDLQDYTEALEDLGFRRLMDYTRETDTYVEITAFHRLFYHAAEHCFAEVNQAFRGSRPAAP